MADPRVLGTPVTVSGSEITDAVRAVAPAWLTNKQGGSIDDAWITVTNRLPNGGMETSTAGWAVLKGGETFVRDTTTSKFGAACGKLVAPGALVDEGVSISTATGLAMAAGLAATASVWVWAGTPGDIGKTLDLEARIVNTDASNNSTRQSVVLSATKQLVTATVIVQPGKTGDQLRFGVRTQLGVTLAYSVFLDGAQFEVGSVAHDYVETNGAPASAGQGSPAGFGIWEAATNLFTNGQCDALTNWFVATSGTTRAIDAIVPARFSPQSVKVTCDGTAANQAIAARSAAGQAAAAGVVGVGSIYFRGAAGQNYRFFAQWGNTDASFTQGTVTNFVATGAWQLLQASAIAVAAGKTGDYLQLIIGVNGTRAESFWVAHAMLQKGVNNVSPYVATSGGATATRNAARVQEPSSLLNATQGWVAMRLRPGLASTASFTWLPIFEWADDASDGIFAAYRSGQGWQVKRLATSIDSLTVAGSFNAGDTLTIISRWDATKVYLSVNGAAFISTGSTHIPALAASLLDIGTLQKVSSGAMDSSVLWFACGTGTLSDVDAAAIAASPGAPDLRTLPGTPTGLWDAVTTATYVPGQWLDSICGTPKAGQAICGSWWAYPSEGGLGVGGTLPQVLVGQITPQAGLAYGGYNPTFIISPTLAAPEAGLAFGRNVPPTYSISSTMLPQEAGLALGAIIAGVYVGQVYLFDDVPLDLDMVAAPVLSLDLDDLVCLP